MIPSDITKDTSYYSMRFEPGTDVDILGLHEFSNNTSFEGIIVMKPCDQSIKKTFQLVDNMLSLADEGDAMREDDGCGILYGVVRDSAFKIKKLAEAEKQAHIKKGWWGE